MGVSEFIDTYSDDLLALHEARIALYTHPLRGEYAFAELLNASFCRIFVVFVVGGIEAMLESWRDRDRLEVLGKYFAPNVKNVDRITNLYRAFSDAGIQVDKEVFDDYLAIKYLRNTIIHGQWKEYEKDWLEARSFPSDSRKLTRLHWDRIERVNQSMMLYIALTGIADTNSGRPTRLVRLEETVTRSDDERGILRLRDIERIIWNNLSRIDAYISADIERTAITAQYDWTAGRSRAELDALGHEECKRLYFLAARRAGEDGHEALARHRDLAKEALGFWREYWQRTLASHEQSIRAALEVFGNNQFNPEMPLWSAIANVEDDGVFGLVDRYVEGTGLTGEQVVHAIRIGKLAYDFVPNIMPVTLLTLRLPIVDPENTLAYLKEAERALDVFLLSRAWYECVERQHRFTKDTFAFYVRMSREFTP